MLILSEELDEQLRSLTFFIRSALDNLEGIKNDYGDFVWRNKMPLDISSKNFKYLFWKEAGYVKTSIREIALKHNIPLQLAIDKDNNH